MQELLLELLLNPHEHRNCIVLNSVFAAAICIKPELIIRIPDEVPCSISLSSPFSLEEIDKNPTANMAGSGFTATKQSVSEKEYYESLLETVLKETYMVPTGFLLWMTNPRAGPDQFVRFVRRYMVECMQGLNTV